MAHLKVITGPMFSGKTEELIRLLRRSDLAGKEILVIKPGIDTRTQAEIASRRTETRNSRNFVKSGTYPAEPISSADQLAEMLSARTPEVLGIDEAQFFGDWMIGSLVALLNKEAKNGLQILVAGLDLDAWNRPFGIMPQLMALADEVIKVTAVCFSCGNPAMLSQKLGGNSANLVEVGDFEIYEARCRACHFLPD